MSRGLGWVQLACLEHIKGYEEDDEWPTTYDIAAAVYEVKPDEDGLSYVTDAQHVAVKRALEGLQRQGRVIGLARRYCDENPLAVYDKRSLYSCYWMSERRVQQWIRKQDRLHDTLIERIKKKMQAIGMALDEDDRPRAGSNEMPLGGAE
jgi:hypothetical protein